MQALNVWMYSISAINQSKRKQPVNQEKTSVEPEVNQGLTRSYTCIKPELNPDQTQVELNWR